MEKNLDTMLDKPGVVTGLDEKKYKIVPLSFPDAFELAEKLNLINLVPIVALATTEGKNTLMDIILLALSYNHPDLTKEKLTDKKNPIFDLGHIRKIIDTALDINELKK